MKNMKNRVTSLFNNEWFMADLFHEKMMWMKQDSFYWKDWTEENEKSIKNHLLMYE